MTPTVRELHSDYRRNAWAMLILGQLTGFLIYKYTGIWVFMLFNLFLAYIDFGMVRLKHYANLQAETRFVLEIRQHGYNKVRMDILQLEEEVENIPNRYERYRKTKLTEQLRGIMEDVKEEIDRNDTVTN